MKEKWYLTLTAFLTATIPILLGLTWLDSCWVPEPALAASQGELSGSEAESADGSAAGYIIQEVSGVPFVQ